MCCHPPFGCFRQDDPLLLSLNVGLHVDAMVHHAGPRRTSEREGLTDSSVSRMRLIQRDPSYRSRMKGDVWATSVGSRSGGILQCRKRTLAHLLWIMNLVLGMRMFFIV